MELKIRELREEARMTQRELAVKIGNSQRNVSNWENGTSEPDIDTLVRLCGVFDVTLEELLGLEPIGRSMLSAEEWRLVRGLRALYGPQRKALYDFIMAFTDGAAL